MKSVQDVLAEAREEEKVQARMAGYDDGYADGRVDVIEGLAPSLRDVRNLAEVLQKLLGKIDPKA